MSSTARAARSRSERPFTSRGQFIVYHFTFDPELDEGCI